METTTFEYLGTWMQNLNPLMSFLTILWIVTLIIFRKDFAERIKNFDFKKIRFFKSKKQLKKISLLKDHDLFNVIERVRSEVRFKKFYTSGEYDATKSKMFIDFIDFHLNTIREDYKKFFDDKSLTTKNTDELKSALLTLMNTTDRSCAKKTKQYFLSKEIPVHDVNYIINLFEVWRNETNKSLISRINGIFSSTFHPDNFEKLLGCLEVISMSTELILKDGVESFEKMNGRFKNLTY
jgi:hypothetical protein